MRARVVNARVGGRWSWVARPHRRAVVAMSSSTPTSPAAAAAAVVWLQRDLRITDHAGFVAAGATQLYSYVLPVYCFDPAELRPQPLAADHAGLGVPQLGPHRLRFLCQALTSLHLDLQQRYGSGLACLWGPPCEQLPLVMQHLAADVAQVHLWFEQERSGQPAARDQQRAAVSAAVHAAQKAGVAATPRPFWGGTLYHPQDLPWVQERMAAGGHDGTGDAATTDFQPLLVGGPPGMPPTMTAFRRALQGQAPGAAQGGRRGDGQAAPAQLQQEPAPPARVVPRPALPAPGRLPPLPPAAAAECRQPPLLQLRRQAASLGLLLPGRPLPAPAETCGTVAAADDGGSDPAADLAWLYQAAGPAAVQALDQLQALTQPAGGSGGSALGAVGPLLHRHPRSAFRLEASEAAAWARLQWLLELPPSACGGGGGGAAAERRDQPAAPFLCRYKSDRALGYGADTSAKLSPFLALGLITPASVHEAVQTLLAGAGRAAAAAAAAAATAGGPGSVAGAQRQSPEPCPGLQQLREGAEQLLLHLDIRDFFAYSALQAGPCLTAAQGLEGPSSGAAAWRQDADAFRRWAAGATGFPFVDANMRELAATGWMSNRGRQNVASFLTKALQLDWRLGAELFRCLLVDHDAAVNLASWAYVAGVGGDPRDRVFKTVTQGERYDPQALLAAAWLPELAALPAALRHRPWSDPRLAGQLGYPAPMLDPQGQVAAGPRNSGGGSSGSGSSSSRQRPTARGP